LVSTEAATAKWIFPQEKSTFIVSKKTTEIREML